MNESRILRSAIWRELYSRRKAFLVSTSLIVSVVLAGIILAGRATATSAENTLVAVGVLPVAPLELEDEIRVRLQPDLYVELVAFTAVNEAEAALRDGAISALVTSPRRVLWGPATTSRVVDAVSGAMRSVHLASVGEELGLTESDVGRLLQPIRGRSIDIEEVDESAQVVAVITVILMFVAIIAYGQWVAYGIVEEKANRVAEVILGTLSPSQVLTAKLISLGGLGLVQLSLVSVTGLVAVQVFTDIELPPLAGSTIVWVLVWFLFGYAFYGALYSAAGSLAADTQEAGSYIGPLNLLPGIGYALGIISFSAGSDLVSRILSYIPLWTPLLMPGRVARGDAATWEVGLALGMMALATLVMVRVASRVYLGGITQATRSVGWRQAFRGGKEFAGAR